MKIETMIENISRAKSVMEKSLEKKSLLPEFFWETFETGRKGLEESVQFLTAIQKFEKERAETEALKKQKLLELLKELDSIADDMSVVNTEAKYIVSRNSSNEASMDKMSAEAIQYYMKKMEEKIAKLKGELK